MTQMELLHVHEILRQEELAARKCFVLAAQARDPQLQNLCRQAGDQHFRHMQMLVAQLENPQVPPGPYLS